MDPDEVLKDAGIDSEGKGWEEIIVKFQDSNTEKKMARHRAAQFIMSNFNFVTFKDTKQTWRFSNPIYVRDGEVFLEKMLRDHLSGITTSHDIEEIISEVKGRTFTEREDVEDNPRYIPLKNGLFDIEDEELKDADSDYFITNEIPIIYDEDADCPKIKKFLHDIVKDENVKLLQEIIGFCLYRDYPIAKAVMFLGDGKNGKSTFLRLLKNVLGQKNIATPSLHQLVENRFAKAELYNKLSNVHGDLSAKKLYKTGAFKMLTGQDPIHADRKYQSPFTFHNYAKLIYSANELPGTTDTTDAFFRRWLIIRFPYKFTENPNDENKDKNPHILKEILSEEELSGLFNFAIKGLKRLQTKGRFSKTDATEDIKEKWLTRTNPLQVFFDKFVEIDRNSFVTLSDLEEVYQEFCEQHDADSVDRSVLSRRMNNLDPAITSFKPKVDGKQVKSKKNVKLKEKVENCIGDIEGNINLSRTRANNNNNNKRVKKTLDQVDMGSTGNEGAEKKKDFNPSDVVNFIKNNDDGEGVEVEKAIDKFGSDAEKIIDKKKSEGELYEVRPGVVSVL